MTASRHAGSSSGLPYPVRHDVAEGVSPEFSSPFLWSRPETHHAWMSLSR